MPETFWLELGKSGPWALVAGFLLWTVIQAWNSDRRQVTTLLGEFKSAIEKLTVSLDHVVESNRGVMAELNRK